MARGKGEHGCSSRAITAALVLLETVAVGVTQTGVVPFPTLDDLGADNGVEDKESLVCRCYQLLTVSLLDKRKGG